MNEKTLVKTMPLPDGQPWALYLDANMVVLSPSLDEAGRSRAMDEMHEHWRRSCLRTVPEPHMATPEPNRAALVQPVATLSQVGH